ncbi:MAG: helix-turn-helix transcriptional regulator [Anaerolineae bacterium]|nr:helix-turn-helix transcriptional regulator [Anaerolineae bacterium]
MEKRRSEIGLRIRELRRQRSLSQEEVAAFMGCSRARVNRVEQGHTEFGVAELELLADMLDVPVTQLLDISLSLSAKGMGVTNHHYHLVSA